MALSKSDFKNYLDAQRYILLSSKLCVLEQDTKTLINNLDMLWSSMEELATMYNIKLKSIDEIINHGKEIMDLEKLYHD